MKKDIYTFAEERKMNLTRVTDVSAGICPLGPSKRVKATIRKAAKDVDLPADQDCLRLKTFFGSKFGIGKDCILFANSGREIMYRCRQALNPAKTIMTGPAFFTQGVPVPDQLCSGNLLIVSNPDRITGRLADKEQLRELLNAAAVIGAFVVLNESLIEFTGDDSFYEGEGTLDNLIILRTTANFYALPGLELAYAVSSPQTIAKLKEVLRPSLNHLAIEAARTALKDKTYIKTTKGFIRDERRLLFFALRKIGGITVFDSDSNVYLMKIDSRREEILSRLNRAGFLIQDCGDIEGLDNNYLRMSVMSHDKNRKLVRILKENIGQDPT
ncbi:MAG: aminotransferase class I/II-fold pyridoxal phosphate-dependent enzyme [Thermodesulfovibrionales bacterium]